MDLDEIQLNCKESMEKGIEYLKNELRGVRTGRASTGLVDYIKVEYYGSPTDLRSMALVNVPEPSQLVVKPFDASTVQLIAKAIQASGLGLNPIVEGKQIRLQLPSLSGERRNQLVGTVKSMAEQTKVAIRNARRDANKLLDASLKDKSLSVSEDDAERAKNEVQELVKKYEQAVEDLITAKIKEIQEI